MAPTAAAAYLGVAPFRSRVDDATTRLTNIDLTPVLVAGPSSWTELGHWLRDDLATPLEVTTRRCFIALGVTALFLGMPAGLVIVGVVYIAAVTRRVNRYRARHPVTWPVYLPARAIAARDDIETASLRLLRDPDLDPGTRAWVRRAQLHARGLTHLIGEATHEDHVEDGALRDVDTLVELAALVSAR